MPSDDTATRSTNNLTIRGDSGGAVYAPSAPHNSAFGLLGHAHQGGMIGGPNAFALAPAPLAAFADTPRFYGGRAMGAGEVPIAAKRGEVVGWPEQLRRAFGSEVVVQIIDQRSPGTRPGRRTMTNPTWPLSLPQRSLARGYSEHAHGSVIRRRWRRDCPRSAGVLLPASGSWACRFT